MTEGQNKGKRPTSPEPSGSLEIGVLVAAPLEAAIIPVVLGLLHACEKIA